MTVKLLTEQHLEFLSLKGGCTGDPSRHMSKCHFAFAGYEVSTIDDCISKARIFVTATGCKSIIDGPQFEKMLEDTIVCNIGHFDCELDIKWLNENCEKKEQIKPQVN